MVELNFVTIGDCNFFPIINFSTKQLLKFYPNCTLYLYDWGFTEKQKKVLNSYPITVFIDWKDNLNKENGYKNIISEYNGYNPKKDIRKHEYMLMQKPYCMLDCSKRIKENLIFIDGDAILINPIDELFKEDFDVGVTINSKDDIERAANINIKSPLNSGVIFFTSNSKNIQLFIQEWIDQMKITRRIWIEQTSLSLLIEKHNPEIFKKYKKNGNIKINNVNINIRILPFEIYNFYKLEIGFDLKKTKIIHLNGRIPKLQKIIRDFKLSYFFPRFIKIFPKFIRIRIKRLVDLREIADFLYQPKKITYLRKRLPNIISRINHRFLK